MVSFNGILLFRLFFRLISVILVSMFRLVISVGWFGVCCVSRGGLIIVVIIGKVSSVIILIVIVDICMVWK